MFIDKKSQKTGFTPLNYTVWFILAFQAGGINIGGFLACHKFVTHTTGFATHFGDEFILGNYTHSLRMLTVPVFFLIGSMISAILVDRRIIKGRKPNYPFAFFFISSLLILTSFSQLSPEFQAFGTDQSPNSEFLLLGLLSLASGVQNALVTTASGAIVRTTHLTGVTTDLGIGIVRLLSPNTLGLDRKKELLANLLRAGTIGSFILGSILCGYLFLEFGFWGFLAPASISMILSSFARWQIKRLETVQ